MTEKSQDVHRIKQLTKMQELFSKICMQVGGKIHEFIMILNIFLQKNIITI